jgi:hypothetical protein
MSEQPRVVQITVEFIKLGEIDTMNEKYSAEILIESKWLEPEFMTNYNPERHWNPQLYIENSLQDPKEKIKHRIQRMSEI